VYAKEDGSLCQLFWYDNKWNIATSGSPDASGNVGDWGFTFEELFWKIWEKIKNENDKEDVFFATFDFGNLKEDGTNHEYVLKTEKNYRKLDFYVKSKNKIIEFDGSYWHKFHNSNKTKEYTHKTLDEIRDEEIKNVLNCEILHIDELEYRKNSEKVLNDCLNFLQEGNNDR
jgi:hypothetical protein